jgi:hypothetical protein
MLKAPAQGKVALPFSRTQRLKMEQTDKAYFRFAT